MRYRCQLFYIVYRYPDESVSPSKVYKDLHYHPTWRCMSSQMLPKPAGTACHPPNLPPTVLPCNMTVHEQPAAPNLPPYTTAPDPAASNLPPYTPPYK